MENVTRTVGEPGSAWSWARAKEMLTPEFVDFVEDQLAHRKEPKDRARLVVPFTGRCGRFGSAMDGTTIKIQNALPTR